MNLPDFATFEPLRAVRQRMGALEDVDLADSGWEPIHVRGIDIGSIEEIEAGEDGTLVYDGRRVLVYIRDQYLLKNGERRGYRFHVAECDKIQEMRSKKRFARYVATTRNDGLFLVNFLMRGEGVVEAEVEQELFVCKYCLGSLDWEGYGGLSGRGAKNEVWRAFSPARFFERYPSKVLLLPTHSEHTAPLNEYPDDWANISRLLREELGWTCEGCGRDLSSTRWRRFLHVHHVDGNRANSLRSNLLALCVECHRNQPDHEHMRHTPDFIEFMRLVESGEVPKNGAEGPGGA